MVWTGQALEPFKCNLEERCDHDNREDENSDRFQAAATDWICVLIMSGDQVGGDPDDGGGKEIESSVHERGQDRDGTRECDNHDLEYKQDGVGEHVDVDGDGDDARSGVGFLLGLEVGR